MIEMLDVLDEAKKLVSTNQLEQAIDSLIELTETYHNEILVNKQQYVQLKKEERIGTLSKEEFLLLNSRVSHNILLIIDEIKKERIKEIEKFTNKNEHEEIRQTEEPLVKIDKLDSETQTNKVEPQSKTKDPDLKNYQNNSLNPEMIFIKGGTFTMGSNLKKRGEKPIHEVTLSDYYISKHPITVAQFAEFMKDANYYTDAERGFMNYITDTKDGVNWQFDANGYPHLPKNYNHPVIYISHYDATQYCQWLSNKLNKTYRLPTEAEWEYAARGGNQSNGFNFSGSDDLDNIAWFCENSEWRTHSVGTKNANELNIHDLSGNVWEWCNDLYSNYNSNPVSNPKGPKRGDSHVIRGGSFNSGEESCRVSSRWYQHPNYRGRDLGFRIASVL